MGSVRLLLWQKWKRFAYDASYWLRTLGYDVNDRSFGNRSYAVYLFGFGAFWVLAMWLFIGDLFTQVGDNLSDSTRATLIDLLPLLPVLIQSNLTLNATRDSPLKLTTNDSTYVATAPTPRNAITLVRFMQKVIGFSVILNPFLTLCMMGLTWDFGADIGGVAGFQTFILTTLIITCCWGAAWVVGLMRLRSDDSGDWLHIYGVGIGLIVLALLPGMLLRSIALGELSWLFIALSLITAMGFLLIMNRISRDVSMTRITDESRIFARISDLGPLAGFYAPEAVQQIRGRDKQTDQPHLSLPRGNGVLALVGRNAVYYLRSGRRDLLLAAAWGVAVITLIIITQRLDDITPLQAWAGILLLVVLIPPRPVINRFREDQRRPFIRQFIPHDDLTLLLVNSGLPMLAMIGAASVIWLWQMGTAIEVGAIIAAGVLVTLALSVDFIRPYQTSGRISYVQSTAVCFGVALLAGIFLETFSATVIVILTATGLLGLYIRN